MVSTVLRLRCYLHLRWYYFYVRLAKLHCGATPPSVMVLYIICVVERVLFQNERDTNKPSHPPVSSFFQDCWWQYCAGFSGNNSCFAAVWWKCINLAFATVVGWGLLKASCYLVQSLIVHDSINSTILSHFRNFPFWNMFLESTPTWKNAWKNSKITQRRYLEHEKIKLNVYLLLKLICKFRANSASSLIIAPVHFCIQALLLSLWNNIKQIYFFQHHHAGY